MFTQNKCLVQYCKNNALSSFDKDGNLIKEKNFCLEHIPNPGKSKEDIYNYINSTQTIIGLNASGIIFTDIDFSNKRFFGCNFSHCTFSNIQSSELRLKMCIFDFANFTDCNFGVPAKTFITSVAVILILFASIIRIH